MIFDEKFSAFSLLLSRNSLPYTFASSRVNLPFSIISLSHLLRLSLNLTPDCGAISNPIKIPADREKNVIKKILQINFLTEWWLFSLLILFSPSNLLIFIY